MLTASIAIASIAQIVLSLFVYLRARNNLSNRLFFFIGLATLGWALSNYLTIAFLSSPDVIYLVRVILFFVVLGNAGFYLFARTFPGTSWPHAKRELYLYGAFTAVAAVITLSPYVFTAVAVSSGLPVTKAGPGIALFIVHAGFSIIVAFRALIKKMHNSTGVQREQFQILLVAAFLNWVVVPITNFGVTPLLKTTAFIVLGPLYTVAFAGIIAYAIVSRHLFDIRSFIVRAAAYLFSIVLLSLLYIVPSILLVAAIMHIHFTWTRFWTGVGVALTFAIFYGAVREWFNRFTNKIFFRGYYEPQEVLNQLSEVLVRSIDTTYLKHQSSKILQTAVKATQLTYWLASDTDKASQHAQLLSKLFHRYADNIILIDEYGGKPDTKQHLQDKDIAVVVRLRANNNDLGFMTLGPKESGQVYSERDRKFLSIAADEIAISLQNALHYEEIQQFNIVLQNRVDEATRKLRRTNARLEALDETKDDFISMASHQLRTPLTSVKGYLSMVLDGDAGDISPSQRKMLSQAFISSQRMVYLIADLLNVSRLKTGKFIIDATPVNLAKLIAEEVAPLVETAQSRGVTLTYAKPANFPILMLDETKTRQVIMNFVDNAIYYTPSGGHIAVELADKPSTVELKVVDDGIGVPNSEQHHLFTKFYRARNAQQARPDGTGLGLFMAKKVVVAQGGAILFDSKEGKGSTFGFTFSKSQHLASIAPVIPEKSTTVKPKKVPQKA